MISKGEKNDQIKTDRAGGPRTPELRKKAFQNVPSDEGIIEEENATVNGVKESGSTTSNQPTIH